MITLIAVSRLIPMKELQNHEKQAITAEDGVRLSVPVETSNPSIRKQSYEEQTNGNEIKT